MSVKTVKLEEVHLTLDAEKLKLQITSAVVLKLPTGWNPSLEDGGILKALTTANIWVSRGRRCRLDIKVFFNGKSLVKATSFSILESLGHHLRDAQLWSQLSLSTSLEIAQSDHISDSSSDISIFVNHDSFSPQTQPKAWLSGNINMNGPHGVLCTEFERLYLQLSFRQIQKRSQVTSKRLKSSYSDPECPEPMLLDYGSGLEDDACLTLFENVVTVLSHDLSNSIAKCFDTVDIHTSGKALKLLDCMPFPSDDGVIKRIDNAMSPKVNEKPVAKRNEDSPHRILDGEEDMLLSFFDNEMLFDLNDDDPEDDEMLFSQTTSAATGLDSEHSTTSTFSSTTSVKRPAADEIAEPTPSSLPSLQLAPASKLALLAIQTLVAGPSNRKRDLQDIRIRKPLSSTSLSLLIPSMFSPGFKELTAQNSKFLPTISNAISSSWVRNVQGAGLRKKLVALSNARVSEYHDGDGEVGSGNRLVAVVQGRLWRMMQRTLFDEGAVKKIWKRDVEVDIGNSKVEGNERQDDDNLGKSQSEDDGDAEDKNFEDYIGEELMEDQDELLFEEFLEEQRAYESDDGLLEYLKEQERLAVDTETDEMLFGCAWEGGGCDGMDEREEQLLPRISSQEESMLL